jgi:hypothetical protein
VVSVASEGVPSAVCGSLDGPGDGGGSSEPGGGEGLVESGGHEAGPPSTHGGPGLWEVDGAVGDAVGEETLADGFGGVTGGLVGRSLPPVSPRCRANQRSPSGS